jgi:hypothetical protein
MATDCDNANRNGVQQSSAHDQTPIRVRRFLGMDGCNFRSLLLRLAGPFGISQAVGGPVMRRLSSIFHQSNPSGKRFYRPSLPSDSVFSTFLSNSARAGKDSPTFTNHNETPLGD